MEFSKSAQLYLNCLKICNSIGIQIFLREGFKMCKIQALLCISLRLVGDIFLRNCLYKMYGFLLKLSNEKF